MLYDIFGPNAILIRRHSWACALILLSTIIILMACSDTPQSATPSASSSPDISEVAASHIKPTAATAPPDSSKTASGDTQQAESGSASASVPPPAASRPPNPYGPPSLDERIFFADAIAVVRPISVESGVLTVQHTAGQTRYSPLIQSRFEAIEYLKGGGDSEIVVNANDFHTTALNAEQALQSAESNLDAQASKLDGGEGVVFLQRAKYPDRVLDTTLKTSETEWRQYNSQTGLFSAGGNISDPSTTFRIASALPSETERHETFSVEELRERIEAMAALLREGEGIEGWKECIGSKLLYANYLRKYRAEHGEDPPNAAEIGPLPSGQPAGFTAHSGDILGGSGYYKEWLTGEDTEFFQILIVEGGQVITPDFWATRNQITHYETEIRATRPLPAGLYEIYIHGQAPREIPCDFVQPPAIWRFTFESSEGTLHEAFFDPVALGDAVGADGASGVLKPAAFTFDGSDAAIRRIDWLDGQARMSLSPRAPLADHHTDFIALDGSVSLRLDFDDAVAVVDDGGEQTLVWGVCSQPWQSGDLLMLRISESPADLAGATFNTDCAPSETPVSPTATPEVTPTETPVPTPTAAPTLTPIPTVSSISAPKAAPTPEQADAVTPTPTP